MAGVPAWTHFRQLIAGLALSCVALALCAFVGPPPAEPTLSMTGVVIVIDPGHNGANWSHPAIINRTIFAGNGVHKACNTTGTATNSGYTEAAYAWDVAKRTAAVLRLRGATVHLTRHSNSGVGPCTPVRAATATRFHADAMLSIHADGSNAAGARGFTIIASTHQLKGPGVTKLSHRLAKVVRANFRAVTGMPYANYAGGGDALVYRPDLATLNLATVPAVLVETGNMRSATDAALMKTTAFRQSEAVAFADALQAFVGR